MSRAWRARRWGAVALASIIPAIASGAGITGVSPQGAVRQVQQVVVSFSEPVVTLGDLRQADPMRVVCQGAAVKLPARNPGRSQVALVAQRHPCLLYTSRCV